MADADTQFARHLRELRTAAGLTHRQLADAMARVGHRFHRSTIGKIENGDQKVSVGEAVQLAAILGVDLATLTTDQLTNPDMIKAQVEVAALQYEAAQRRRNVEDARILRDDALERLAAAARHLAYLYEVQR